MTTDPISLSGAPRVRRLSDDLINQIAAGEVVERPASAVKELVENAIDAGARSIEIILEDGGKKLIEVIDDGCGMSGDDARLAIERHATSKISCFEDLQSVATLGFRGEALPSIASVSRFALVTSTGGTGTEIEIEPGCEPVIRPAARTRGTTVRVAHLFENVPARKKFLKSANGEFRAVVSVVTSYALPAPARAFRLWHNGRMVLDLPPERDSRDRVLQILGDELASDLWEVAGEAEMCSVGGFVSRSTRFGSRRNQFFFVNGRVVKDRVLTHAVNRAVESFDADGQPAIVLFIDIDPAQLDVNVHPAKTEVRFRDSARVHVAVESGIRRALARPQEGSALLERPAAYPEPLLAASSISEQPLAPDSMPGQPLVPPARQTTLGPLVFPEARGGELVPTPLFRQGAIVQPPREEPRSDLGDLRGRVIGQYRDSYILLDTPEGLRLVDQHVAHERVLYDRIAASLSSTPLVQRLLTAYVYETGAAEGGVLASQLGELRAIGFEIEPFSGRSFAISAIPTVLARDSLDGFLRKVVDAAEADRRGHVERVRDKLVATLACHAAIKVHRPLTGAEMSRVVSELLASSNPFACPHGRPIIVDIRHFDIERHFHRK
jgi:DNA mismatch repair protein MutL